MYTNTEVTPEHKQQINNSLDDFTLLLCNQPFTPLLCDILLECASPALHSKNGTSQSQNGTSQSKNGTSENGKGVSPLRTPVSHVVRDQSYKLLFDWIKRQSYKSEPDDIIVIDIQDDTNELVCLASSKIKKDHICCIGVSSRRQ